MSRTRSVSAPQAVHPRALAFGLLLAGATAVTVWSVDARAAGQPSAAPTAPAAAASNEGAPHPMGHMGHGGGMHGGMGMPFSGRALDRMLDTVKANDAQRTQIREIADKARADLQALHQQMPKGADGQVQHPYRAIMALLAQPQVDAAGAERLRQQLHAHHDGVSKRMLQAAADVAKVLTPEQRATLAKEMQRRMDRRDGDRASRHPHHPGRDGMGRPEAR